MSRGGRKYTWESFPHRLVKRQLYLPQAVISRHGVRMGGELFYLTVDRMLMSVEVTGPHEVGVRNSEAVVQSASGRSELMVGIITIHLLMVSAS